MAKTLNELRTEVETRMSDTDNFLATDSEYNSWINSAVQKVAREWPWPFLRATTAIDTAASDDTLSLPATVGRIRLVEVTADGTPLLPKTDRWLHKTFRDPTSTGQPRYYSEGPLVQSAQTVVAARQLLLKPTPDSIYSLTVSYYQIPPTLTSDTHYPLLPDEFTEAVVLWAVRETYRKVDDAGSMGSHDAIYKEEIVHLVAAYGLSQHERFPELQTREDELSGS